MTSELLASAHLAVCRLDLQRDELDSRTIATVQTGERNGDKASNVPTFDDEHVYERAERAFITVADGLHITELHQSDPTRPRDISLEKHYKDTRTGKLTIQGPLLTPGSSLDRFEEMARELTHFRGENAQTSVTLLGRGAFTLLSDSLKDIHTREGGLWYTTPAQLSRSGLGLALAAANWQRRIREERAFAM